MSSIISDFTSLYNQYQEYKRSTNVIIDGCSLSVSAIAAVSRDGVKPTLDRSAAAQERVKVSRALVERQVAESRSIYGVTTGVGGSANTRSEDILTLGASILQHIQTGVLVRPRISTVLPLSDQDAATSMPEAWVRGALMMRINSMIRGHSGVRWEVVEKLSQLLEANVIPLVPLRGSVSASGDLAPLAYLAGAITGNPHIRVHTGPIGKRVVVPSSEALAQLNIEPAVLQAKEPLAIVNGTGFSTSVGALAVNEAIQLSLISIACTAMATEALMGAKGSFAPFIHAVARPHPGQVDVAESVLRLLQCSQLARDDDPKTRLHDDRGTLRQDRYPLRTAPQYLGPQLEDIHAAMVTVERECNATTDNPLTDVDSDIIHMGGNFQAMPITNAMEKTRVAIFHIGKLLFSQSTEICNPSMNNGLPPSVAATDPSVDYHAKGVDVAMAAFVAELGFLANPVGTHAQSAEMHNQSVNSMALVTARATITSLEVLSMLIASHVYILCQALDLRAMQQDLFKGMRQIISEEVTSAFGSVPTLQEHLPHLLLALNTTTRDTLDSTTTMDLAERMRTVGTRCSGTILTVVTKHCDPDTQPKAAIISTVGAKLAVRGAQLLSRLRVEYLLGERGAAPASPYLGKTKPLYEYIRSTLRVPMHGRENLSRFAQTQDSDGTTIGEQITTIYEAMQDGKLQAIVVRMLTNSE